MGSRQARTNCTRATSRLSHLRSRRRRRRRVELSLAICRPTFSRHTSSTMVFLLSRCAPPNPIRLGPTGLSRSRACSMPGVSSTMNCRLRLVSSITSTSSESLPKTRPTLPDNSSRLLYHFSKFTIRRLICFPLSTLPRRRALFSVTTTITKDRTPGCPMVRTR
jgi:hypothetical protein